MGTLINKTTSLIATALQTRSNIGKVISRSQQADHLLGRLLHKKEQKRGIKKLSFDGFIWIIQSSAKYFLTLLICLLIAISNEII